MIRTTAQELIRSEFDNLTSLAVLDNLIMKNPNKRPHLDAFRSEILMGDKEKYTPLTDSQVDLTLKQTLALQFQDVISTLTEE